MTPMRVVVAAIFAQYLMQRSSSGAGILGAQKTPPDQVFDEAFALADRFMEKQKHSKKETIHEKYLREARTKQILHPRKKHP